MEATTPVTIPSAVTHEAIWGIWDVPYLGCTHLEAECDNERQYAAYDSDREADGEDKDETQVQVGRVTDRLTGRV